jgi:hypothetical protein
MDGVELSPRAPDACPDLARRPYHPAPMADRSYARYLAPLALVVFVVAAIVVVANSDVDKSSSTEEKTATAPNARTKSGKLKKFYRVRPGDLLSEISDKTDVDVQTIIKLNPDVDPQALQAGQLIRIRR